MGRSSEPWYRTGRQAWATIVDGRTVTLAKGPKGKTEAAARKAFDRLMGERARADPGLPAAGQGARVGELVTAYLSRQLQRAEAGELAATSCQDAERRLEAFRGRFGRRAASDLTPGMVEAWLASCAVWGPTTRHDHGTAIRAVFRWAKRSGRIGRDPLEGLEVPPRARRREVVMGGAAWPVVRSWIRSWEFRLLCEFLYGTGCRPGEACRLEARNVDWERAEADAQDADRRGDDHDAGGRVGLDLARPVFVVDDRPGADGRRPAAPGRSGGRRRPAVRRGLRPTSRRPAGGSGRGRGAGRPPSSGGSGWGRPAVRRPGAGSAPP